MCRFALYLGKEITVSSLLTEPANSIIHQSFHSHEREEPLNGDGFGIAWYIGGTDQPAIFKDISPAWNNQNLLNLARVTRTSCLLAHVRAASPGLPVQQLNCHPFSNGPLSFMHNGTVGGFHAIRRRLLSGLSDEGFDSILGSTDSEHVFALVSDHIARAAEGADSLATMQAAIRAAIGQAEELRHQAKIDEPSFLNLALTDGRRAVVSRFVSSEPDRANTLYVHSGSRYVCEEGVCRMVDDRDKGAVIVASEPLSEDSGWEPVPPNHLVTVDEHLSVTINAI